MKAKIHSGSACTISRTTFVFPICFCGNGCVAWLDFGGVEVALELRPSLAVPFRLALGQMVTPARRTDEFGRESPAGRREKRKGIFLLARVGAELK
jgi:hypothetical protein